MRLAWIVILCLCWNSALWAQVGGADPIAVAKPTEDGNSKGLRVAWQDRFLEISGAEIPGGPIRIHYLEAYCRPGSTDRDWGKTVIPHQSKLIHAAADGRRLELEDRLADGVIVSHEIVATQDAVTFSVRASNPTEEKSEADWAQPCMRVDRFTGANVKESRRTWPAYIEKCFLMVDGELQRLPTRPWALQARYTPGQVYVPSDVNRADVNPRPLSVIQPSSGLTGCFSADESKLLAIAWEPYQEIFQGVITCMHSDFRIGGLMPGETKVIRGKFYLMPADEDSLVERFHNDFPGGR